jgi:hypothetical protein
MLNNETEQADEQPTDEAVSTEMAKRIYTIITVSPENDGTFRRDLAIDALFEAMTWLLTGVDTDDNEEWLDGYLEYVHDMFHSAFNNSSTYAHLALTHQHEDIIWDDELGDWVVKAGAKAVTPVLMMPGSKRLN